MNPEIRASLDKAGALHSESMRHSDRASALLREGKPVESREELRKAFEAGRDAADTLRAKETPEPSRSVLHRSAASVAIRLGQFEEARRLVNQGLDGDPPREIAQQLRALLDRLPVVAA